MPIGCSRLWVWLPPFQNIWKITMTIVKKITFHEVAFRMMENLNNSYKTKAKTKPKIVLMNKMRSDDSSRNYFSHIFCFSYHAVVCFATCFFRVYFSIRLITIFFDFLWIFFLLHVFPSKMCTNARWLWFRFETEVSITDVKRYTSQFQIIHFTDGITSLLSSTIFFFVHHYIYLFYLFPMKYSGQPIEHQSMPNV